MSDFSVNLADGKIDFINPTTVDWNVTLVDTGSSSMTGGRLLRLKKYINNELTQPLSTIYKSI